MMTATGHEARSEAHRKESFRWEISPRLSRGPVPAAEPNNRLPFDITFVTSSVPLATSVLSLRRRLLLVGLCVLSRQDQDGTMCGQWWGWESPPLAVQVCVKSVLDVEMICDGCLHVPHLV